MAEDSAAPDVLNEDLARSLRLQTEYLTPEFVLERRAIRHTIAVYGSTRTRPDQPWYTVARAFGGRVAREGGAIVTGGGPGIMEAANRGALEAGGASIGMNIELPHPQRANAYITPGLSFSFRYFALRKLHFLLRARALVVFPGGFGTLDELFETLMLVQTGRIVPLPVVLADQAYWQRIVDFDLLVAEGMIDAKDRGLACFAESAGGIWERIETWYAGTGRKVFPARQAA
ncbi:MAG: TIGR00730 family Rossman fold protein [Clostridia bacterium]